MQLPLALDKHGTRGAVILLDESEERTVWAIGGAAEPKVGDDDLFSIARLEEIATTQVSMLNLERIKLAHYGEHLVNLPGPERHRASPDPQFFGLPLAQILKRTVEPFQYLYTDLAIVTHSRHFQNRHESCRPKPLQEITLPVKIINAIAIIAQEADFEHPTADRAIDRRQELPH